MSVLKKVDIFATYETVEELQAYIDQFSGSEKVIANMVMGLTWNTCAHLVNQTAEPVKAYKHLIRWGLDQGYKVEVYGEGELDYSGLDFEEAVEAVEACDVGNISLLNPEDNERLAWFSYALEWNQPPEESISDWGINEITSQWEKAYFGGES